MSRYASSLPPIRINPAQQEALHGLAERLQTSASSVVRMAIAEFLTKHGFNPSSTSVPE